MQAQASFLPFRLFRCQPDASWLRASWAVLHTGPPSKMSCFVPRSGGPASLLFQARQLSAKCGTCSQEAELLLTTSLARSMFEWDMGPVGCDPGSGLQWFGQDIEVKQMCLLPGIPLSLVQDSRCNTKSTSSWAFAYEGLSPKFPMGELFKHSLKPHSVPPT